MTLGGLAFRFSLTSGIEVVETDDDEPPPLPAEGVYQQLLIGPMRTVQRIELDGLPIVVVPASTKVATRLITPGSRPVGVLCRPTKRERLADGRQRVYGYAMKRVLIQPLMERRAKAGLRATVEDVFTPVAAANSFASIDEARRLVAAISERSGNTDAATALAKLAEAGAMADFIAASGLIGSDEAERRRLLNTTDAYERLTRVVSLLRGEAGATAPTITAHTATKHSGLNSSSPTITTGQTTDAADGVAEEVAPRPAMVESPIPPHVLTTIDQIRADLWGLSNDDQVVSRRRIEMLQSIPWAETTTDAIDLDDVRQALDSRFVAMNDAKHRLIEFLAVRKIGGTASAVVLLDGPPGVGKTAFGKSVADFLGRKFVKLSMAGVAHPFDLAGTAPGWKAPGPGLLVQAVRQTGVMNPVIMLDELDKIGVHEHGDPSHVLLAALDPEQNTGFVDNFLGVGVDLSDVIWILTSNDRARLSRPLLDRAEVIEMPAYGFDDQLAIAQLHLVPQLTKEHGLTEKTFGLSDEGLRFVVTRYGLKPGVRDLKRRLAKLMRAACVDVATNGHGRPSIGPDEVETLLGSPHSASSTKVDIPGMITTVMGTGNNCQIVQLMAQISEGIGQTRLVGAHRCDAMQGVLEKAVAIVKPLRPEIDWKATNITLALEHPSACEPDSCTLAFCLAILSAIDGTIMGSVVAWGAVSLAGQVARVPLNHYLLAALQYGADGRTTRAITGPLVDQCDERTLDMTWLEKHFWTAGSISEAYNIARAN